MSKDPNKIAAIEQAISKKYGKETIQNPKANWDDKKEQEYVKQSKEFYKKVRKNDEQQEKVDVNGIKVSKKLLNNEPLATCSNCSKFSNCVMDDVCFSKFECCNDCYIKYVEGRESRWNTGWRPNNDNN
tara:strand:+ start:42756 stop:43142 length:387 start_codon:yes stop_codon:yes gene_type:complete